MAYGDKIPFGGLFYDRKQLSLLDRLIDIARVKFEGCIKIKDQNIYPSARSLPCLEIFIKQTILESNTPIPNVVIALMYLDRFGTKLALRVNGAYDSRHRIFLACLVVACKYLNDVTYKNEYWASIWKEFSVGDVNLMERELLIILNFNLVVHPKDMEFFVRRYFRYEGLEKSLFTHQPWAATLTVKN